MALPVVVVAFPQDGQPELRVLEMEEHAGVVAVFLMQMAEVAYEIVACLIQPFGIAIPLFQQQQVGAQIEDIHMKLFLSVMDDKK